ncbi:hypothetical protein WJX84_007812 [Apatococcus fuscideae]|uniref:NAD(P)-binding domain-containing protein n=1 Tax=Apatococcus fuscideae TaxID=2026836 RepID=A0AAW1TG01_9CHLO
MASQSCALTSQRLTVGPASVHLRTVKRRSCQPVARPCALHVASICQPSSEDAAEACSGQTKPVFEQQRRLLLAGAAATWFSTLVPQPAEAASVNTVFVAGASGKTGKAVVKYLSSKGVAVRAGVRDIAKAKASDLANEKNIQFVEADVTKSSEVLTAAIGNADAVIIAIGYGGINPSGFEDVDKKGTINLVDAAKKTGAKQVVMLSSLLTNGGAVGQGLNPNFLFLNLFGGVLNKKHDAELYLRKSGLDWTIVRPGGLSAEPESAIGNLITRGEDTLFGRDSDPGREISRETVGKVLAEAVLQSSAKNKVVEIVSSKSVSTPPVNEWFNV